MSYLDSLDVITALKLESFPGTFKRSSGFCPNRPKSNGKDFNGDEALETDIPFSFSKKLERKFSSKGLSLMTTLKLPKSSDDVYLTRFTYDANTIGLRIGSNLRIIYRTNRLEEFTFDVNLLDNKWHRIAIGVRENRLSLYVDCTLIGQKSLKKMFSISSYDDVSLEFGQRADDTGPGFVVSNINIIFCFQFKIITLRI